jgi:hypothetical protein
MCPIPNCFRDRAISLYSSKIVDKKYILRTFSKIGIYCSSDKIGTVYLVWYIFENSTVNINAHCNSCEDMAYCSFGIGHKYIYIFLLGMADTMTSQDIELSSSDTLYT